MTSRDQLVGNNGQPAYGIFPRGVGDINFMDFDLRNSMDRKMTQAAKRRRFNQFEFIGITSSSLIIGIAIVDLKLVSNAFVYLFNPATRAYKEYRFFQPLSRGTRFGTHPNKDTVTFVKGRNRITIRATQRPGIRQIRVSLKDGTQIRASIDESTNYHPLALCTRTGYEGWTYTQKIGARVCHGSVVWNGDTYNLEKIGAMASVDWTGGFMRRETVWNWASLSCRLADGRRLGVNLAAGVNETGFTENALWLDDQLIKINQVDFRFDRYKSDHAWGMHSDDGKIQLFFEPRGQRCEKINALIIQSNFTQHFGQFFGDIILENEVIHLDGQWGFAEDHYAKW